MRTGDPVTYPRAVARKAPGQRAVIDLAQERARRRLSVYEEKIGRVLESNQRAFGRLHDSGALFSDAGVRAGRDLLLAHQHLLRVRALLERLGRAGTRAQKRPSDVERVYAELDGLLDRTHALTHRTGHYLARLGRE